MLKTVLTTPTILALEANTRAGPHLFRSPVCQCERDSAGVASAIPPGLFAQRPRGADNSSSSLSPLLGVCSSVFTNSFCSRGGARNGASLSFFPHHCGNSGPNPLGVVFLFHLASLVYLGAVRRIWLEPLGLVSCSLFAMYKGPHSAFGTFPRVN